MNIQIRNSAEPGGGLALGAALGRRIPPERYKSPLPLRRFPSGERSLLGKAEPRFPFFFFSFFLSPFFIFNPRGAPVITMGCFRACVIYWVRGTHLPGSSLPACRGLPLLPAALCPPGLAREARAEREGAREGPAGTLADGLRSHRGVAAELGAAPLILQSTNIFLCRGGRWSMPLALAPRFAPLVKSLLPFYRWGRRGTERGGNLQPEEMGRKALSSMLQLPGPSPRAASRHCVPLPGPAAIRGGLCAGRRRACRAEDHMAGGN